MRLVGSDPLESGGCVDLPRAVVQQWRPLKFKLRQGQFQVKANVENWFCGEWGSGSRTATGFH